MAKKTVICDVCGLEMEASKAHYDIGSERDLCDAHFRAAQLEAAKAERDKLIEWLEATHLKRLRELDQCIAELETPNSPASQR